MLTFFSYFNMLKHNKQYSLKKTSMDKYLYQSNLSIAYETTCMDHFVNMKRKLMFQISL